MVCTKTHIQIHCPSSCILKILRKESCTSIVQQLKLDCKCGYTNAECEITSFLAVRKIRNSNDIHFSKCQVNVLHFLLLGN